MMLRDLFRNLGGQTVVARARGVTRGAVHHWAVSDKLPPEHHLPLWRMAIDAGLDWQPPGAEGLREALCVVPPAAPQPAASEAA